MLSLLRSSIKFRGSAFKPSINLRSIFIQTASTPNPLSQKFIPGRKVLEEKYGSGMDFRKLDKSLNTSPLARKLFRIDNVVGVFLGPDFVSITKSDTVDWAVLKPLVFQALMDFYADSNNIAVTDGSTSEFGIEEGDSEVVMMIKELLDTRIRPAVHEDGGDIFFHSFDEESGKLLLRMAGSCAGCPSSSVTLKQGVQNMLKHYIPEVTEVDEIEDDTLAEQSVTEFETFEKKLSDIKTAKRSQASEHTEVGDKEIESNNRKKIIRGKKLKNILYGEPDDATNNAKV